VVIPPLYAQAVTRSPWPLLIAIAVTVGIGIGSVATRDQRRLPAPVATGPAHTEGPVYVAIGDSFTAGDAIGVPQPGLRHCLRSADNYPSLVARELGYALTDVSCSGATTHGVLNPSSYEAAQVAAVTRKAALVTVSIGGNDLGTYSSLILTCLRKSRPDARGAPCRTSLAASLSAGNATITRRVGTVLDAVRERAPSAKVLVITYLGLMPHDGTCAAAPFSRADVAWFASVEDGVSDAMAAAAERRDVDVVDAHDLSRDHHVCSGKKAWVNGPRPKDGDGILFHPNGAGERAVAEAVIDHLRASHS
jgi:lysophospholipase L1-like esterase